MIDEQLEIKCRIFKRERQKPTNNSKEILTKNSDKLVKNQIELTFINKELELAYVEVACRVMLKEWDRVLPEYSVLRAFVSTNDENQFYLYVTFEVMDNLGTAEIKKIVYTATTILEECLIKVTEKVSGKQLISKKESVTTNLSTEALKKSNNQTASVDIEPERVGLDSLQKIKMYEYQMKEQANLIQRLKEEVAYQDEALKALSNNERDVFLESSTTDSKVERLTKKLKLKEAELKELLIKEEDTRILNGKLTLEKIALQNAWQKKFEELEGQSQIEEQKRLDETSQSANLLRQIQALTTKLQTSEEINQQLDKANIKLNNTIQKIKVDVGRVKHVGDLEKKLKELEFERNLLKDKNEESERSRQRFESVNERLSDTLERLETNHNKLLKQSQTDNEFLESSLATSEKRLVTEASEKQKIMMEYQQLQKLQTEQGELLEKVDLENKTLNRELSESREILKTVEQALNTVKAQTQAELTDWMNKCDRLEKELAYSEEQRDKIVTVWEEKYQLLEVSCETLEIETESAKTKLKELLDQMAELESRLSDSGAPRIGKKGKGSTELSEDEYEEDDYYEEYYYVDHEGLYEEDPFVEEVAIEELAQSLKKNQEEAEFNISELFEESEVIGFKEVRLKESDYRKLRYELKFLNFRWNQIYSISNIEKNMDFLKECLPYVEDLEEFKNSLSNNVKKSLFNKKYVTIDSETLTLLEAYSALSVYLDTYYLKVSSYIDKYFLNEENN